MPDSRPQPVPPPKPVTQAPAPDASKVMTLFVMLVATLYFGKEVLVPVTLALLLAFILAPLVDLLRRLHLGRVVSVLLGVVVALGVVLAIGGVIGTQVADLASDIPRYAVTIEQKVSTVRHYTVGQISSLADKVGAPNVVGGATPPPAPQAGPREAASRDPRPRHRHRQRRPPPPRRSSWPTAILLPCCRRWPRWASCSWWRCSPCCSGRTCGTG